jgi:hypothetical protein
MRIALYGLLLLVAAGCFALREQREDRRAAERDAAAALTGTTADGARVRAIVAGGRVQLVSMAVRVRCESGDRGVATVAAPGESGARSVRRDGDRFAFSRRTASPWAGGLERRAETSVEGRLADDGAGASGVATLAVTWLRSGRVVDRCRSGAVPWSTGDAMRPAAA